MFLSSVVVGTPNGQFLGCVTVAFSERYDEELQCRPSATKHIRRV
jgi:hypothetical protein